MGYFDSIKNNQLLTVKEKKNAFDKQLRENKQKIYPHVVLTILNAIGCSKLELARRLGVSAADITRITTESFHMSPNTLIRLCALVFNMSCHTFLFGEPSMTSLPASLKLVCKTVDGWSDFWKHECLNKLKYLKDLNKEFSGQYAPTTEDIFTERILEIASDKYCPPEDFLGKEVCAATIDLHQTSDTIECQPALQSLFADCSFQEQSIILDIAIAVKQSLRNHVSL